MQRFERPMDDQVSVNLQPVFIEGDEETLANVLLSFLEGIFIVSGGVYSSSAGGGSGSSTSTTS